jgi:hypothetical protein
VRKLRAIGWPLLAALAIWMAYELWPERPVSTVIQNYDGLKGAIHRTTGLLVQFWFQGELFATRDQAVFRSRDRGISWQKVAELAPRGSGLFEEVRHRIGRLKLVRRLRGACGIPVRLLRDGTMLAVSGGIFQGRIAEGEVVRLKRTHTGPGCLSQGWAEDRKSVAYLGEYQLGDHPQTRLYSSRDVGRSWEIRYEFPRSEIEHVHAVAYDPYRDLLWLATGDANHESRILFSADQGMSFRELGGGSQDWRAVSLQFTEQAVFWGTDDPKGENHVFRWDWDTRKRELILSTRNPFYYSAQDGSGSLFFGTAAELPEYGGEGFSELWELPREHPPQRLIRWPRGQLKKYRSGMLMFAQGTAPEGWLAVTPVNLAGHHCEALVFETTESHRE